MHIETRWNTLNSAAPEVVLDTCTLRAAERTATYSHVGRADLDLAYYGTCGREENRTELEGRGNEDEKENRFSSRSSNWGAN